MWGLVVLFTLTAAAGAAMLRHAASSPDLDHAQEGALVRNMALYRSLVVEHVRTHPSASGAVPDSALAFPPWYTRHAAWRNNVLADGTIVVYSAQQMPPSMATELVEASHGSLLAGEARRRTTGETFLYSPRHGDTGISLPAINPGAAVWLARAN